MLVAEDLGTREGSAFFPSDLVMSELAPDFGRELKRYMKTCTTNVGNIRIEMAKTPLRGEINVEGRAIFGETEKGVSREYLLKNNMKQVIEFLEAGHEIGRNIVNYMKPKKVFGLAEGIGDRFGTNHSHGSCRAGASPENSVTNSDFESHDIDNLFICDASSLPFQGTANPSMPTAAVCAYAWRRMVVNHFSRA